MLETPLRITLALEINGKNEWEPLPSDFGQSDKTSVNISVCFGPETSLVVALAAVLARVIKSIGPPRPFQILAGTIAYFDAETEGDGELVETAEKVCRQYEELDNSIKEAFNAGNS
jgi:hypothetical protein